ncbi:T9SS type A sorting domain-containing protein [bacterium]|nr:T9SS type A sorting domain-containing protein [bacterium]
MKRALIVIGILILLVTEVSGVNFSPTVMKLSAPSVILYQFDGSELKIPVTVNGAPASAVMLVYTSDQGASVNKVRNGYLGWHYVNKIDTCVFASQPRQFGLGSNTITWNGKDSDGKYVPMGNYTYYIWAYDNVSAKIPMSRQIEMYAWAKNTIVTQDQDGKALNNPIVYQGQHDNNSSTDETKHNNIKWVVGNDPGDKGLIETCTSSEWNDAGGLAFLPGNYNFFFKCSENNKSMKVIRKWEWIPNGEAILQTAWGDQGEFRYSETMPPGWDSGPGIIIKDDFMITVNGDESGAGVESEVIYVDLADGTEIKRLDISEWYISIEDAEAGGQSNAGPNGWQIRGNKVVTNAFCSCMNLMFDILYEDEGDAVLWANDNGDYTGDHNFEADSAKPWVCNDYNVGPYKYNIAMDENLFSVFPSFDLGAVSFGLFAPDGTGLGYHAFASETAGYKSGIEVIDYGSSYDGYYTSNYSSDTDQFGWFFVGHDSIKGIITVAVSVDENTPAGFSVAQNTPNPFNPSTTISFTIPETGNVKIDVYNAAGQKVDTITQGYMTAGSHSVVWNASDFSAGVYFGTVTYGNLSQTVKMILVK